MRTKKKKYILEMPKFSWDMPIEQELLKFVTEMANRMEEVAITRRETGWFANNSLSEGAQNMADAYRTVQRHIEKEIDIRSKVKL